MRLVEFFISHGPIWVLRFSRVGLGGRNSRAPRVRSKRRAVCNGEFLGCDASEGQTWRGACTSRQAVEVQREVGNNTARKQQQAWGTAQQRGGSRKGLSHAEAYHQLEGALGAKGTRGGLKLVVWTEEQGYPRGRKGYKV